VIQADSQWAFPKEGSYKMALRKMRSQHDVYRGLAKELQQWVCEEFTEAVQYEKFVDALLVMNRLSVNPDIKIPTAGFTVVKYE
jgi:hypothetical protein